MARDTQSDDSGPSYRQYRAVFIAFLLVASPFAMPLMFTGINDTNGTAEAQADSGETIFIAANDGVFAYDRTDGTEEWNDTTHTTYGYNDVTISEDGQTVYAVARTDTDNRVVAYDADTGQVQWNYIDEGGTSNSIHIEYGQDGVFAVLDGQIDAIDPETGDQLWTTSVSESIRGFKTSQDGSRLFVARFDNNVREYDTTTGDDLGPVVSLSDTPTAIEAGTDGESIYIGDSDNNNPIGKYDLSTGDEIWSDPSEEIQNTYSDIEASSGSDLVFAIQNGPVIRAFNGNSGSVEWERDVGDTLTSVAEPADDTYLYTGMENGSDGTGTIRQFEQSTGNEVWNISHSGFIDGIVATGTNSQTDQTTGQVTDQNGDPIDGATVTFRNVATGSETTTQTGSTGNFGIGVETGRYEIEISAGGYQTLTVTQDIEEGDELGTFQLSPQQLDLQFNRFVEPGTSTPYTVEFTGDNGTVMDVTGDVSINSSNASVATVDTDEVEIVGSSGVNGTAEITANYTVGNETYTDTRTVTVATKTVDNLEIIPGTWRLSALLDDITIQVILVAIGAAIVATRAASAWAGLGAMELVIIIGWFAGWVPIGIAMLGLFTALFIGLNLAANIDYSVRR